uniref:Chromo domain-containing protein n=1 Tax=Ditylenchus dipsaci TaxID=166011 RepID=A0A915CZC8_9BILA
MSMRFLLDLSSPRILSPRMLKQRQLRAFKWVVIISEAGQMQFRDQLQSVTLPIGQRYTRQSVLNKSMPSKLRRTANKTIKKKRSPSKVNRFEVIEVLRKCQFAKTSGCVELECKVKKSKEIQWLTENYVMKNFPKQYADFGKKLSKDKFGGLLVYPIDKVVGKKIERGELFYQVKWWGYAHCHNTWETAENLAEATEQIANYENSLDTKKKGTAQATTLPSKKGVPLLSPLRKVGPGSL